MTAALEGGEWSAARLGRTLPPGKTRYPFYRRLGGPQGRPVWTGGKFRPHGDSIPDRPARSQPLYRPSYTAHTHTHTHTHTHIYIIQTNFMLQRVNKTQQIKLCERLNTFWKILVTLVLLRSQQLGNKFQWSFCVPLGVTFTISTFCPRNVLVCFVCIWEQTVIISLYSINCRYWVAVTESLCVWLHFVFQRVKMCHKMNKAGAQLTFYSFTLYKDCRQELIILLHCYEG